MARVALHARQRLSLQPGAAPESQADGVHYPGTYVAGLYNRVDAQVDGEPFAYESIVNLPNWLPLRWRIEGGEWFDLHSVTILDFRQELDLRRGLLSRSIRFEDGQQRRTRLTERRFVHMRDQHLAALETTIVAENWSGRVEVRSAIDGAVANTLVADDRELNHEHLDVVEAGAIGDQVIHLKGRTRQSRIETAVAARTRVTVDGELVEPEHDTSVDAGSAAWTGVVALPEGSELAIEKIAAVYTSRDRAISESSLAACQSITRADPFDALLDRHVVAWSRLWRHCATELAESDDTLDAQLIVQLHLFHLLQTTSTNTIDIDVGVPARGWSEAYRGHIFWDELIVLPYLNMHLPEVSRSLLLYRYRRLGAARAGAREAGYRGAMYPWRSGSDGREVTPPWYYNPRNENWIRDHTHLQRHIGLTIAFNIWTYVEVTGDRAFLNDYGAEMMLEIARFWSSIATYSNEHERYEIHGGMGPDEFHTGYPWSDEPGLSNNTYTNVMAAWVLWRARDVLDRLPAWRQVELREALGLDDAEPSRCICSTAGAGSM